MRLESLALLILVAASLAIPAAAKLTVGSYASYSFNLTYEAKLPRHQGISVRVTGILSYQVTRTVEVGNRTLYVITVTITNLRVEPFNGTSQLLANAVRTRLSAPLTIVYDLSRCTPIPTQLANLGAFTLPFYCSPSKLNTILDAMKRGIPGLKAELRRVQDGYLLTAEGVSSKSVKLGKTRAIVTERLSLHSLYNLVGVLSSTDSKVDARLQMGNFTGFIVSKLSMRLLRTNIVGMEVLPPGVAKKAAGEAMVAVYAALAGIAIAVAVAAAAARRS